MINWQQREAWESCFNFSINRHRVLCKIFLAWSQINRMHDLWMESEKRESEERIKTFRNGEKILSLPWHFVYTCGVLLILVLNDDKISLY